MTDPLSLALPGPDATDALGARLAQTRPPRAVVYLEGELGSGKSSLARALLRALGVTGPVRSPTYTLVERYPVPGGAALHLDLYRIADPGELAYLALDALADEAVLWLIEWPQRGGAGLPPADLRLRLAVAGEGRRCEADAGSPVGRDWLGRLARICPDSVIS
ncbi:MAG: tRNA (adenosine(37)-N6)-threonylcarbamoyltransferase complex ATPase subunit type 1 TsaE [Rehaibacterium terrae]|uniref:tRNA (adenosine(37)-N6)-threonylcarbamoyltransferase complex ATPase subunit type 1 TsaE n=1 Tax=Rehaibacterium terrae TaxID=1341696 RepID=UPI00391C4193